MPEFVIRSLAPALFPLAKKFYKHFGQATKTNRQDQIYGVFSDNTMQACARIAPYGDARLLRGVFVAPDYRGQGLGSALITHALEKCSLNEVWTFPYTHLNSMYEALGFHRIAVENAPDTIQKAFKAYSDQGKHISLMRWKHL